MRTDVFQMQLLGFYYGDMGVAGGTVLPLPLSQPLPGDLAHGVGGFTPVCAAGRCRAGGFGASGSKTLLPAPPQVPQQWGMLGLRRCRKCSSPTWLRIEGLFLRLEDRRYRGPCSGFGSPHVSILPHLPTPYSTVRGAGGTPGVAPARDGNTKASAGFAVGFFPSSTSAKPFTKAVASWGFNFHRSNFLQVVPRKVWGDPRIILGAASHSNRTQGDPHVHPKAGAQPRAWLRSPPLLANGTRGAGKHNENGAAWLPLGNVPARVDAASRAAITVPLQLPQPPRCSWASCPCLRRAAGRYLRLHV